MKRLFAILLLISAVTAARAQNDTSVFYNQLTEVRVRAAFRNDTDRYRYNQMKYYVTTVLPYVNAATALFNDVHAKGNDATMSRHDYKRYLKSRESVMRTQFEDKIKGLNVTQGVLLVKLIARQTDLNIYSMIAEVKNPIAAIKWQSWARLNGMNLNKRYDPQEERVLENIMLDLGYPLPATYASR